MNNIKTFAYKYPGLFLALPMILPDILFFRKGDALPLLWMNCSILFFLSTGLAMGLQSTISIHFLVNAKWSDSFVAYGYQINKLMPFLLLLFIPVCIGLVFLSPFTNFNGLWLHPAAIASRSFLILFAFYYFSKRFNENQICRKPVIYSIISLALILISLSIISSDWFFPLMLRNPIASMPFLLFVSFLQLALSFIVLSLRNKGTDFTDNLGRYLLAVSLFWFYFIFSAMLIDWYAHHEAGLKLLDYFFDQRNTAILMITFTGNAFIPLLLMQSGFRQKARNLKFIGYTVFITKFFEFLLYVSPSLREGKFIFGLTELACLILCFNILLHFIKKSDVELVKTS